MAKEISVDDLFQQFTTNWLQRYGPIVGYCMEITSFKRDSFQASTSGILPVESDRLKRLHRIHVGEMEEAVCFNIMLVIPSIPAEELFWSLRISERISSLEHWRIERCEVTSYGGMGTLEPSARLKHSEKKQLKVLAISAGVLEAIPLSMIASGIEDWPEWDLQ